MNTQDKITKYRNWLDNQLGTCNEVYYHGYIQARDKFNEMFPATEDTQPQTGYSEEDTDRQWVNKGLVEPLDISEDHAFQLLAKPEDL